MILNKTTIMGVLLVGLVGCSNNAEKKELLPISDTKKIDRTVLEVGQEQPIETYEFDVAARVYILGECAKLVDKGEKTPKQCENAARAEYNILIKEIHENTKDGDVSDFSQEEKDTLKHQILTAYTYGAV